jgi:hypothetical protein
MRTNLEGEYFPQGLSGNLTSNEDDSDLEEGSIVNIASGPKLSII